MGSPFEDDSWPEPKRTQVKYDPEAPFVVDLPDGQKLLIGELPEGTIIEVAAWRGTHKPDSRTTRLLLGVKKDEPQQIQEIIPEIPVSDEANEWSRKMSKKSSRKFRAWIGVLIAVTVIAVGAIAFYLSPLNISNPTEGIDIGFGPADSAVVITAPVGQIESGQMLVAETSDSEVILGRVAAQSDNEILLQTATGYSQISEADVTGTVVVLVPFIGYIF